MQVATHCVLPAALMVCMVNAGLKFAGKLTVDKTHHSSKQMGLMLKWRPMRENTNTLRILD